MIENEAISAPVHDDFTKMDMYEMMQIRVVCVSLQ